MYASLKCSWHNLCQRSQLLSIQPSHREVAVEGALAELPKLTLSNKLMPMCRFDSMQLINYASLQFALTTAIDNDLVTA